MNTFDALRLADNVCWGFFQRTKEIGATLTTLFAATLAQAELHQCLKEHARAITTDPDGTITYTLEDGALRGKGLYWRIETLELNAHRERLTNAVREALRRAEEAAPGNARFAQAEVGHCLLNLDGSLFAIEDNGEEDSLIKEEYDIVFTNAPYLRISGHGTTWWFGRLFQEGHAELIGLTPETTTA